MRFVIALIITGLIVSPAVNAGDEVEIRTLTEGTISPPATLTQLGWLVGYWKGESMGGEVMDIVVPAAGGQMMAMFNHVNSDDAVTFFEFYVIAEIEGSLMLRIKHFTPDLIGWESKDSYQEFPLVAAEDAAVYFDGLTFKMTDDDTMQAAVNVEGQGIFRFKYQRLDLN